MFTKAMDDTLGLEGIVQSALVFGVFDCTRPFYGSMDMMSTLAKRADIAGSSRNLMAPELARAKGTEH